MLLTQVFGVFNIFVGLMLVAAFLLFFGGLAGWFARLGVYPGYRDDMIRVMMWGVAVLFTLVLLLAVVHVIQTYQVATAFIVGLIIFVLVVWMLMFLITSAKNGSGEGDDEH